MEPWKFGEFQDKDICKNLSIEDWGKMNGYKKVIQGQYPCILLRYYKVLIDLYKESNTSIPDLTKHYKRVQRDL